MSLPVLAAVVDAVDLLLPPIEDEEFGLGWADIEAPPFEVTWVAYRNIAGQVSSGAYRVNIPSTLDAIADAWASQP